MKNKKEIKYTILVIIIILIASLITLSFAYLAGEFLIEVNNDIKVELGEQAEIVFTKGDDLSISANAYNMQENGEHLSSDTTASVTLTAYGNYTANYYVYFDILSNDFEYTTEEETPELILQVYKNGKEVEVIDGLLHTESMGVSGFDVTITKGVLEIGVPEVISLTDNEKKKSSITDEWEFVIYFINFVTNQ